MPVSKKNNFKKAIKPSGYPEQVLKVLVNEYASDPDVRSKGMSETMLAVDAGFDVYSIHLFTEMNEVLRILEEQQYIKIVGYDHAARLLKPTMKGINHARWLMRPWYKKVWDYLKGDIRTVVIAIITAVIITILTALILRLLNLN